MQTFPISAMTVTSAAGQGLDAHRKALSMGRGGLRSNDFPHCSLKTWIGRVEGTEAVELPGYLADRDCRNNQLALLGIEQDGFVDRIHSAKKRYGSERVGCILGTSTAGISATEAAYRAGVEDGHMPEEYRLPRVHTPHTSSDFISALLGIDGPVWTISTACSSSAKVFASGARMIQAGLADAVIVGGADSLCLSVLYGFNALELVSGSPCRPFDQRRDGLSLGEAAGFALLERQASDPVAMLAGWGESSDAWHMAAPHPEGAGARAAMEAALKSARLEASDIGYINLHGTATPQNDATETGVIRGLFGESTPASSTKGWTGHTLGAAGIAESVFSLLALTDGLLPATLNCDQVEAEASGFVLTEPRKCAVDYVATNSFGFGGSNCTLIFGKAS